MLITEPVLIQTNRLRSEQTELLFEIHGNNVFNPTSGLDRKSWVEHVSVFFPFQFSNLFTDSNKHIHHTLPDSSYASPITVRNHEIQAHIYRLKLIRQTNQSLQSISGPNCLKVKQLSWLQFTSSWVRKHVLMYS